MASSGRKRLSWCIALGLDATALLAGAAAARDGVILAPPAPAAPPPPTLNYLPPVPSYVAPPPAYAPFGPPPAYPATRSQPSGNPQSARLLPVPIPERPR